MFGSCTEQQTLPVTLFCFCIEQYMGIRMYSVVSHSVPRARHYTDKVHSWTSVRLGTLPRESFAIEIDSIGLQVLNLKPKMNLWCHWLRSGNKKSYLSQKKRYLKKVCIKKRFRKSEISMIFRSLYKKRFTISDTRSFPSAFFFTLATVVRRVIVQVR